MPGHRGMTARLVRDRWNREEPWRSVSEPENWVSAIPADRLFELAQMREDDRVEFILDNSHIPREELDDLLPPELGAFIRARLSPLRVRLRREGLKAHATALTEVRRTTGRPARPSERLNVVTPSEFESLIGSLLDRMGLSVRVTKLTRDGGVDCVAVDNRPVLGGTFVVQVKRWAGPVGEAPIRDLYGVVMHEGANKGIIFTTSWFTADATRFAARKPLELVDGGALRLLLDRFL